ncbi:MAG TPA: LysR family transcriptional regulator, partial [Alicycliphilus sp.]|nr:LysR family transcriptional regulator [Alicycliphilus sp.]
MLTTYLLRRDTEPTQVLARFIERFQLIGSTGGDAATIRGGV